MTERHKKKSQTNILLVEGEADRAFFEALCQQWQLPVQTIDICTPRDAGQHKDTKQAALGALNATYLSQLNDGTIEHLAIVMDADHVKDGGGFTNTLKQLNQQLTPAGYALRAQDDDANGLLWAHSDGLNDIGAWVMPNNADEGALEHWIVLNLHPQEAALMRHAKTAIDSIPDQPKFKPLRRCKAEVATWLAWQSEPDHGLWQAAEQPYLLNELAPQMQAFKAWMLRVFSAA